MSSSPTCAWFWQNYGRTSSSTARTASALASTPSTTASTRLRHSPRALCARGFLCGYLDTGYPDHDIDYGDPSHSYLDQGCSAQRSRLPRHRHKGLSPRMSTSSASSTVQASAPRHRPRPSRWDCGGMLAYWVLLRFISSLTVRDVPAVHDATATTAGEC